jgi:rhodanese-related sulfurtransferase
LADLRFTQEAASFLRQCPHEELKAKLLRGDRFVLLEALQEEHFRRSHLPGARNLPYDHVKQVAPDNNAEIATYCVNRVPKGADPARKLVLAQPGD